MSNSTIHSIEKTLKRIILQLNCRNRNDVNNNTYVISIHSFRGCRFFFFSGFSVTSQEIYEIDSIERKSFGNPKECCSTKCTQ